MAPPVWNIPRLGCALTECRLNLFQAGFLRSLSHNDLVAHACEILWTCFGPVALHSDMVWTWQQSRLSEVVWCILTFAASDISRHVQTLRIDFRPVPWSGGPWRLKHSSDCWIPVRDAWKAGRTKCPGLGLQRFKQLESDPFRFLMS
jgi:hypothetical protein